MCTSRTITYCVLLTLASGCGLFETRSPEDPSQSPSFYVPPTVANLVIDNLRNSIIQQSPDTYIRCFIDSGYRYIPSAPGASRFPSAFIGWTKQEEDNYFRNLVSHKAAPFFSNLFTDEVVFEPQGDSTIYSSRYTYSFDHDDASFPNTSRGRLRMVLRRTADGTWAIAEWRDDEEIDTVFTWTDFRGKFRN